MMRSVAAILCLLAASPLAAQSFRWKGGEFNAVRTVALPADAKFAVVVTEFWHHGEISADGKNVVVLTGQREAVPTRVLQLGPGDFCRIAFQTLGKEHACEVCYGGTPPPDGLVPEWTSTVGLLLETRTFRQCNLNRLESVRSAFDASERIGADYVDGVHHAYNPFASAPAPFMSYYSGYLHIPSTGTYGFFTSSQDCSFLLVDGNAVATAPGRHGPRRRIAPGVRRDLRLTAGEHKFEYYHAAAGTEAVTLAAWVESPQGDQQRPVPIPASAFAGGSVGRAEARDLTTRREKSVPDFRVDVAGDVPLPDNDRALVGVQFTGVLPQGLAAKSRLEWDFGDGQKSADAEPLHVYLHPGVYTVTLTVRRGGRAFTIANRVQVDRPRLTRRDKQHTLDDYLPILADYDPKTLDAEGLCQLVLARQWKADQLLTDVPAEALKQIAAAVAAGKTPFVGESAAEGDAQLLRLARLVGPMARNQLGDARLAGHIWFGAAQKIFTETMKAECELEAADVAVNDLGDGVTGKDLLEAAARHLGQTASRKKGDVASRLQRVWGDYHALTGNGEAARKAYHDAASLIPGERTQIERIAWQGAYSRSTEEFLAAGELGRAVAEIHAWQDAFPTARMDGYLSLVYARYWSARGLFRQAVLLSDQLQAVNPDSPYADQLLLLAAECEAAQGHTDRAAATLESLLNSYPGSPLAPEARRRLASLSSP